mgnify:CR=1 FL=1
MSKWIYFIFICCFFACGKFVHSPYASKVSSKKLNSKGLKKIAAIEASHSDNFKVAVISDTHDYYSDLDKQVKYINDRKNEIAFVLHTGDSTNLGLQVEFDMFLEFIDKLKVPFVMVIGNHDMLTNGVDIYKKYFSSKLNFSFSFKQTKFILFNNNNWESTGEIPNLNFVEKELQASSATHNILLAHVQPDDDHRYSQREIDDMKALVDAHGVKLFINGHNHNYGAGTFGSAKRITVGSPVKGKIVILSITNAGITSEHLDF